MAFPYIVRIRLLLVKSNNPHKGTEIFQYKIIKDHERYLSVKKIILLMGTETRFSSPDLLRS